MPSETGPLRSVAIPDGASSPLYGLRFDEDGVLTSPLTSQELLRRIANESPTDIVVFCHGWNNDFGRARKQYERHLEAFAGMMRRHDLNPGRDFRPFFVGIFWPSTALVLPWESGPDLAPDTGVTDTGTERQSEEASLIDGLAAALPASDRTRFHELVGQEALGAEQGRELVELLAPLYEQGDPEIEADPGRSTDEVLAAWLTVERSSESPAIAGGLHDFGSAAPRSGPASGDRGRDPEIAGLRSLVGKLDPRKLVRMATVWQMKDRAGRVGFDGVGALLDSISESATGPEGASGSRIHLVGHSYGCRVLLSAMRAAENPVTSMLLLQPAVNHLCFAERLPSGGSGGYRPVLDAVEQPIMTTFSAKDDALHRGFHLAVRRGDDVGEIEFSGDEPPSEYAALGGYGPRGLSKVATEAIKDPVDRYVLGRDIEVLAVKGDRRIGGHGDVTNEATAWALYNLMES